MPKVLISTDQFNDCHYWNQPIKSAHFKCPWNMPCCARPACPYGSHAWPHEAGRAGLMQPHPSVPQPGRTLGEQHNAEGDPTQAQGDPTQVQGANEQEAGRWVYAAGSRQVGIRSLRTWPIALSDRNMSLFRTRIFSILWHILSLFECEFRTFWSLNYGGLYVIVNHWFGI